MENKLARELLEFADQVKWHGDIAPTLINAYARIRVARINACAKLKADDE